MDSNLKKLSMQVNLDDLMPASEKEKEYMVKMRPSTTAFQDGVKRLKKNKVAMVSFAIIILITLASIVVPMFWPYKYEAMLGVTPGKPVDASFNNLRPFEYSKSEEKRIEEGEKVFPHVFGTDSSGRDYFIRVIYGTRISLAVGFFASIIVLVIGLVVGSVAGYAGGMVDIIIMRIVDVIYSLPDMLLIILLAVVLNENLGPLIQGTVFESLGSNMIAMFIVFALLYWVGMARLIRGQILQIKKAEFVLAARTIGTPNGRILRKHIIPNCLSVIIITTALQVPSAIFTESYLSFLGLGVSAPMTSLGSLANAARDSMQSYPHRLIIPAVIIVLIVLALNLLGDGLRDAFDSKLN